MNKINWSQEQKKEAELEINKIYNEDCLSTMAKIPNDFIALTVTSPPYDNLRTYDKKSGFKWNFEIFKPIAEEIYRVTKEGGVVVWVVGDATIKGSETGTSFKQALYFKECGFNLHDTMIYEKNSSTYPAGKKSSRYSQIFEYMFVFSKGKTKCNLIIDKPNKWKGFKDFSGKLKNPVLDFSPRNNIWKYTTSFNGVKHPAPFPEKLANDHILSWSNENDLVYDPFMGSGTTAKMALLNNRNFIGSEISSEYCEIAKERIKEFDKK
ncbi:MAG: site-specific DNA-methyltransferase [Clostridia bacterium]|nr:site-specific DNA-methyltransferase [Clostridia bacterium]